MILSKEHDGGRRLEHSGEGAIVPVTHIYGEFFLSDRVACGEVLPFEFVIN